MTTIADLDAAKADGAVLQFAHSDYRYRISVVDECSGYDCPAGDDCAGVVDLDHIDYPGDRSRGFSAHVAATDTLPIVADARTNHTH